MSCLNTNPASQLTGTQRARTNPARPGNVWTVSFAGDFAVPCRLTFLTVTLSHVICDPAGNHLPWTPLAARRSPRRHRSPHLRWNSSDYRRNTHLALFGTGSSRNTLHSIRPKVIRAKSSCPWVISIILKVGKRAGKQ